MLDRQLSELKRRVEKLESIDTRKEIKRFNKDMLNFVLEMENVIKKNNTNISDLGTLLDDTKSGMDKVDERCETVLNNGLELSKKIKAMKANIKTNTKEIKALRNDMLVMRERLDSLRADQNELMDLQLESDLKMATCMSNVDNKIS